jgi:hypothetical protein
MSDDEEDVEEFLEESDSNMDGEDGEDGEDEEVGEDGEVAEMIYDRILQEGAGKSVKAKKNAAVGHLEAMMDMAWHTLEEKEVNNDLLERFGTYLEVTMPSFESARNYLGAMRSAAIDRWGDNSPLSSATTARKFKSIVMTMSHRFADGVADGRKTGGKKQSEALSCEANEVICRHLAKEGTKKSCHDRLTCNVALQGITRPQDLRSICAQHWRWCSQYGVLQVFVQRVKVRTPR